MHSKLVRGLLLVMLLASVAAADTIIDSGAGKPIACNACTGVSGSTTTVAIGVHPLWEPNNPTNPGKPSDTSAVWVSYDQTGYGGSHFQAYQGTTPVATVTESFTSGAGNLILKVWSDDTADVILDGTYLTSAVFTQSICSGQPIGCQPTDFGSFNQAISAGTHTLQFLMYQVGTGTDTTSNPFGLLYTGTASAVPEPTSLLLFGTGLVGLAGAIRRKLNR